MHAHSSPGGTDARNRPESSLLLGISSFGPCALVAIGWLASFQDGAPPAHEPADGAARGIYMAAYASGFLRQLDEGARELATASFDVPERRSWAFGPVRREGIKLDELKPATFGVLEALLDTALSAEGMEAWRQIRELENVLRELESTPERVATHRDPDLYWLRVYGDPDPKATWSWRFEGHHFALHVTCAPGEVPTVTPFFLGASPLLGLRPDSSIQTPRVAAFERLNGALNDLIEALDESLAKKAQPELTGAGPKDEIIERPRDIRMGPGQPQLPAPSGVQLGQLSPDASQKLDALFGVYLELLDPELRSFSLSAGRPEDVHFARWGSLQIDEARTWSILTKTFALELATTDRPGHVHALLRDVVRDFGGD